MAWRGWPPVASTTPSGATKISEYNYVIQLWEAVRERKAVIDGCLSPTSGVYTYRWPRGNVAWYPTGSGVSNTITSITASGFTDSGANFPSGVLDRYFARASNPAAPYLPVSFDVVIDDNVGTHPSGVVHSHIISHDDKNVVISDISDYVTSKRILSLSSLVGKNYYFVKHCGLWWSDRWPTPPNDPEEEIGTITEIASSGAGVNIVSSGFRDSTKSFRSGSNGSGIYSFGYNTPSGYEAIFEGDDSKLHRLDIKYNNPQWIYFDPVSGYGPDIGGRYSVVRKGRRSWPGIPAWCGNSYDGDAQPFLWYGGTTESYWTHWPNDSLSTKDVAALDISWDVEDAGSPDGCSEESHTAFDVDNWSSVQEDPACSEPDDPKAPDLYKTIRSIQNMLVGMAPYFVDAADPALTSRQLHNFTPATLFYRAGINAYSSTVTAVPTSNTLTINTISLPRYPIDAYVTVFQASNWNMIFDGVCTLQNNTTITGAGLGGGAATWVGATVRISLGWTRYYPENFKYLFDKTIFIPDVETSVDPFTFESIVTIKDPPESGSPGLWASRGYSGKLKEHTTLGFVSDSGSGYPNNGDFTADHVSRYIGDNQADPFAGVTDRYEVTDARPLGKRPDLDYWDRFYVGMHPTAAQKVINRQKYGTTTWASGTQLKDENQNWWTDWYGGGTLRTEVGSGTGGSSTTLTDTRKATNGLWDASTGRWTGFILEVSGVRRPITSFSGTTLGFDNIGFNIGPGWNYQIREPKYELNRWKDRKARVYGFDGVVAEIPILYSDDNTLYLNMSPNASGVSPGSGIATTMAIASGMHYEILDPEIGTCWMWRPTATSGNKVNPRNHWIKPPTNEPDPRSSFVQNTTNWSCDQKCILPYRLTNYGPMMHGDYVNITLLQELYDVINLLVWTKLSVTWTAKPDDGTKERTIQSAIAFFQSSWADAMSNVSSTWAGGSPQFSGGPTADVSSPPRAVFNGFLELDEFGDYVDGGTGANESKAVSWARVDGIPACLYSKMAIYLYATIDNLDTPEHSTVNPGISDEEWHFNNNGDSVVYHQWSQVILDSAKNTVKRWSGRVGTFNEPTHGIEPNLGYVSGQPFHGQSFAGWYAFDQVAIIKWNVAGGFEYVLNTV